MSFFAGENSEKGEPPAKKTKNVEKAELEKNKSSELFRLFGLFWPPKNLGYKVCGASVFRGSCFEKFSRFALDLVQKCESAQTSGDLFFTWKRDLLGPVGVLR